MTTFKMFFV